ncbi:hypothetical protein H257_01913 [Aphanomyces astaci]|uniref:Uncharacterized protein n=1 Tax=Aphanomyces astaci TaxID=112090 RepID=W4H6E3_APHAT|nr:hypothetical protein H257_01913 [Aphanomyces astaci]ETV86869.1 hypothetical protein H257_01913 [Aphanomyces astaci]|eukprot:XP_009823668.1 hypothetical protein H257_01913 [Aphanomyces astaci]
MCRRSRGTGDLYYIICGTSSWSNRWRRFGERRGRPALDGFQRRLSWYCSNSAVTPRMRVQSILSTDRSCGCYGEVRLIASINVIPAMHRRLRLPMHSARTCVKRRLRYCFQEADARTPQE